MKRRCKMEDVKFESVEEAKKKVDKSAFSQMIQLFKKTARAFGKIGNIWLFERVPITEEIADLWLKNNVINRPTNAQMHRRLTNTIASGGWIYDGACISSTASGISYDGQNRIKSFKKAGCPDGIESNFTIDGNVKDEDVRRVACARGSNIPYSEVQKTRECGFGVLSTDVTACAKCGMQFATWIGDDSVNDLPDDAKKDFKEMYRNELTQACTTCHGKGSVFNPMIMAAIIVGRAFGKEKEVQKFLDEVQSALLAKSVRKEKVGMVISDAAADCYEWCKQYRCDYNAKKGQRGGTSATQDFVAVGLKAALGYITGKDTGIIPGESYIDECNDLAAYVVQTGIKRNAKLFPPSQMKFIMRKN